MAEHLKINGYTMVSAIQKITAAKSAFDSIGDLTDAICTAVGGDAFTSATNRLTEALTNAGTGWSIHRKALSEGLKGLAEAMAKCIEQFEDVDKQLADGMRPK